MENLETTPHNQTETTKFATVNDFYNSLPENNSFYGAGFWSLKAQNLKINMITLNQSIYLFKEIEQNGDYIFSEIEELPKDFLKSDEFMKAKQSGLLRYNDFETDLEVEIKLYEYYNEKRIILNPVKKIDLLFSIHFHKEEDEEDTRFEIKQYPSLQNVIKIDQMNKKLNSKLNTLTQRS